MSFQSQSPSGLPNNLPEIGKEIPKVPEPSLNKPVTYEEVSDYFEEQFTGLIDLEFSRGLHERYTKDNPKMQEAQTQLLGTLERFGSRFKPRDMVSGMMGVYSDSVEVVYDGVIKDLNISSLRNKCNAAAFLDEGTGAKRPALRPQHNVSEDEEEYVEPLEDTEGPASIVEMCLQEIESGRLLVDYSGGKSVDIARTVELLTQLDTVIPQYQDQVMAKFALENALKTILAIDPYQHGRYLLMRPPENQKAKEAKTAIKMIFVILFMLMALLCAFAAIKNKKMNLSMFLYGGAGLWLAGAFNGKGPQYLQDEETMGFLSGNKIGGEAGGDAFDAFNDIESEDYNDEVKPALKKAIADGRSLSKKELTELGLSERAADLMSAMSPQEILRFAELARKSHNNEEETDLVREYIVKNISTHVINGEQALQSMGGPQIDIPKEDPYTIGDLYGDFKGTYGTDIWGRPVDQSDVS